MASNMRSVRLFQEQFDRLNFVHFVNIKQKEDLKRQIMLLQKKIRLQIR